MIFRPLNGLQDLICNENIFFTLVLVLYSSLLYEITGYIMLELLGSMALAPLAAQVMVTMSKSSQKIPNRNEIGNLGMPSQGYMIR